MSNRPTDKEMQHVQELNGVPTLPSALRADFSGTVPNGGHGGFPAEERVRVYTAIREFLTKNGVMPK